MDMRRTRAGSRRSSTPPTRDGISTASRLLLDAGADREGDRSSSEVRCKGCRNSRSWRRPTRTTRPRRREGRAPGAAENLWAKSSAAPAEAKKNEKTWRLHPPRSAPRRPRARRTPLPALLLTLVLSCVVAAAARFSTARSHRVARPSRRRGSYSCYGQCDSAIAEKAPPPPHRRRRGHLPFKPTAAPAAVGRHGAVPSHVCGGRSASPAAVNALLLCQPTLCRQTS